MASAVTSGKVLLAIVMIATAYGDGLAVDYPNLADKVRFSNEFSVLPHTIAPAAGDRLEFP
jgi:hypothetical protein